MNVLFMNDIVILRRHYIFLSSKSLYDVEKRSQWALWQSDRWDKDQSFLLSVSGSLTVSSPGHMYLTGELLGIMTLVLCL